MPFAELYTLFKVVSKKLVQRPDSERPLPRTVTPSYAASILSASSRLARIACSATSLSFAALSGIGVSEKKTQIR